MTSQCHLLGAGAHQAVPTPARAARGAVSSLHLFPVISGIIQLVFPRPQGHRMTLGVTSLLALRSLAAPQLLLGQELEAAPLKSFFVRRFAEPRGCTSLLTYRRSLPSLLSSGASLAPLVLPAGLWTPPVLAVLLPTRGHLLLPELVFPPSALSGKGFQVFVALANNEAKILFFFFFIIGFWAVIK